MASDVQVVYEHQDYGQGYAESKVGLRIGERVQWYGYTDHRPGPPHDEYLQMEAMLRVVVRAMASEEGPTDE